MRYIASLRQVSRACDFLLNQRHSLTQFTATGILAMACVSDARLPISASNAANRALPLGRGGFAAWPPVRGCVSAGIPSGATKLARRFSKLLARNVSLAGPQVTLQARRSASVLVPDQLNNNTSPAFTAWPSRTAMLRTTPSPAVAPLPTLARRHHLWLGADHHVHLGKAGKMNPQRHHGANT